MVDAPVKPLKSISTKILTLAQWSQRPLAVARMRLSFQFDDTAASSRLVHELDGKRRAVHRGGF